MNLPIFLNLFHEALVRTTPALMTKITKRCRPYEKNKLTQDTPTAKNFEQHVNYLAYEVLKHMSIEGYPAVCECMSDTAIETDSCIIQLDAKACMNTEGTEFRVKKDGLQIHCGIAQTSLSSVCKKQTVKGIQSTTIDGKPVYTLLSFLRWGYNDGYFAESVGTVQIPHDQSMVKDRAGKSSHELRMVITNPELWQVHSFEIGSAPHTPDSVRSTPMDVEDAELPDLSSLNLRKDPEPLHSEDKTP